MSLLQRGTDILCKVFFGYYDEKGCMKIEFFHLMIVILFQPQQDTISVKDSQSTGEATTPASCKGRVAA